MHHSLKELLYQHCLDYVQGRIRTATEAMQSAQESANSESKSSAGDKYETGRAMAQLERDRHAQLLAEARRMLAELEKIQPAASSGVIIPGSLVHTSQGFFFLAVSAGKLELDGTAYFAVSAASPIGRLLLGKQLGDTVVFNKLTYEIRRVD